MHTSDGCGCKKGGDQPRRNTVSFVGAIHTLGCMSSVPRILVIGIGLFSSGVSLSQIVRVTPAEFLPAAGIITFREKPLGTVNPTYVAADYGGGAGVPTVTFKSFFQGQSLGLAAPPCPVGAHCLSARWKLAR